MEIDKIECTIRAAAANLREENPSPFIIYGEPQSGKTEMMICLAAKLLDEGFPFIAMLLMTALTCFRKIWGGFRVAV